MAALVAVPLLASGCGGSSKPEYCSKVTELEGSVEELKNVQLESGALPSLQADLKLVQSNAEGVVNSAKQEFPTETTAVKSSTSTLAAALQALAPAPTPAELLSLAPKVTAVVSAVEGLSSATESACG